MKPVIVRFISQAVCILLKVAAGTLDASTKIYAVRVDAVHADAYRVLGGLGAETKPGEGEGLINVIYLLSYVLLNFPSNTLNYAGARMQVFRLCPKECKTWSAHFVLLFEHYLKFFACCAYTDNDPEEEDGSEGVEVTAKQPKKKRPPKRTVEQNLGNINSAESERKCEVWCHLYRTV